MDEDEADKLLEQGMRNLLVKGAEAIELLRPRFGMETLTAATGVVALLLPLTSVSFPLFIQMLGFAMGINVHTGEELEDDLPVAAPSVGGDVN